MSEVKNKDLIYVDTIEQIREKQVVLAKNTKRPIAVFYSDGEVFAVDNRCPHLGFPLHKGSVKDGRLTCHWHEARFDLCSGCTFDLWADDVAAFETVIRDGEVYLSPKPKQKENEAYYRQRLENGLRHNIPLVQAKAILGLRKNGVKAGEVIRVILEYGSRNSIAWGSGMTTLSVVTNLTPHLSDTTLNHALIRASRTVSENCAGMPQSKLYSPLGEGEQTTAQLKRWLRDGVKGRQRDASERALQTLISKGDNLGTMEALFSAEGDRVYTNFGHEYDAINKAFELLENLGWNDAKFILPLTLHPLLRARGAEESPSWHSPVELIEPLRAIESRLPALLDTPRDENWKASDVFINILKGNNALEILEVLEMALIEGAPPIALAEAVTLSASQRLSGFAKSNEVGDWFSPQHTFIFCHAVYQSLHHIRTPDMVRSIFHGALAVYQDRFLNVPNAKLPTDDEISEISEDPVVLLEELSAQFDQRGEWNAVGKVIARYLRLRHPLPGLIDTLVMATLREDLDFHTLQVLEAAIFMSQDCENTPSAIEHLFIGAARQLDAVSPTPRKFHKIALTAEKLERGVKVYED